MPRIKRIAVPNTFIGVAGTQEYLRRMAGLTLDTTRW
jgi:transketolase